MSHSPSSVRWNYDSAFQRKHGLHDFGLMEQVNEMEPDQLSEFWNTPSSEEISQRRLFRRNIWEETLQHRRIHRHGGLGADCRNISQVLWDRQTRGGTTLRRNFLKRNIGATASASATSMSTSTSTSTSTSNPSHSNSPAANTGGTNQAATGTSTADANSNSKTKLQLFFAPKSSIASELKLFAEYYSVTKYHSAFLKHLGGEDVVAPNGQRPSSSRAVSTISIAFSPDSKTMASTHGDHTVKISSCGTGQLLQTLDGHPRTPWTVKYHPIDSNILASGCLGFQVRLWDWSAAVCLHMVRLEAAIISLSFHPTGKVLAIANGQRLHFWALGEESPETQDAAAQASQGSTDTTSARPPPAPTSHGSTGSATLSLGSTGSAPPPPMDVRPPPAPTSQGSTGSAGPRPPQNQQRHRGFLTELVHPHTLRCVHFPPNGNTIIVGGVNPNQDSQRPRRGANNAPAVTFYLRLWDFDLATALRQGEPQVRGRQAAIRNPRAFVSRALLYNDGGFDVSPDGKTLCACAEYWLPNGVNNAMDLIYPPQDDDCDDEEMENVGSSSAVVPDQPNQSGSNATSSAASHPATEPVPSAGDSPPPAPRPPSAPPSQGSGLAQHVTTPQTPPPSVMPLQASLSPPSPPGRRHGAGISSEATVATAVASNVSNRESRQQQARNILSPPRNINIRAQNQLVFVGNSAFGGADGYPNGGQPMDQTSPLGRYVPHVVTISLETSNVDNDFVASTGNLATTKNTVLRDRPRLGQLLEACPLDGAKASAVTCVKFSPSTNFCLIGYGVREPVVEHNGNQYHPVTALYRVRGGMTHVSTMLSGEDDVNIARFHPDPGYGFVYGTKQGRVRVLCPRPWNFYNC